MQASIDIGNSRIKIGVFNDGSLVRRAIVEEQDLLEFLNREKVDELIVSSVAGKAELINRLRANFSKVLEFTNRTPIPLVSVYTTPETLGKDRLAAAAGALQHFSGPLLVIDIGSCITCDLVNEMNQFVGGTISPGLAMRLKAMHTFTRNLPLLEPEEMAEGVPGSTKEAMLAGAIIGAKHELLGFIGYYQKIYPELKVIICGGDAKYFDKMNEMNTFVLPNLVLEGLDAILRYNGEE